MTESLYERVLGAGWPAIAAPVRELHGARACTRARGRFQIARGGNALARLVAKFFRLPEEQPDALVCLVITRTGGRERWRRTFGGLELETRQHLTDSGHLAERFGRIELRFTLAADQGALMYRQVRASIVAAGRRLLIPAVCAPRIDAREEGAGAGVRVHVRILLPGVGPLLTYRGLIELETEPAASRPVAAGAHMSAANEARPA